MSRILSVLRGYDSAAAAVRSGRFLFHGSGEPIAGRLRPGGFDGVLWTAHLPGVAQAYIPACGSTLGIHIPGWRLDERVRPDRHGPLWNHVVPAMGVDIAAAEPEWDSSGRAKSWRIGPGHPTWRDVQAWLAGLGYDAAPDRMIWLNQRALGDNWEFLPADYRMEGRLFVTLKDDFDFLDLRRGSDGDLQAPDHLRLDAFGIAAAGGHDGIVINDFLQSPSHGNVGHVSWGLLPAAAARAEWLEIPAAHYDDPNECRFEATPEFENWWNDQVQHRKPVCGHDEREDVPALAP